MWMQLRDRLSLSSLRRAARRPVPCLVLAALVGLGTACSEGGADKPMMMMPPPDGSEVPLTGNPIWARALGSTAFDVATATAADPSQPGAALYAGTVEGEVDLGQGPRAGAGGYDVFLGKYAADGQPVWTRRYGSPAEERPFGVAVGGDGSVVLVGYFKGTLRFGTVDLTTAGDGDVFVAKLTAAGEPLWARRFGGPGNDSAQAVAVDGQGGIVVTGYCGGGCDLGQGPVAGAGAIDAFVLKLTPAGVPAWSRQFGSAGGDAGFGITVDGKGRVTAAGGFSGAMDPGSGALAHAGKNDAFVAQYAADGTPLWARSFGGPSDDDATSIAASSDGVLVVAGYYQDTMTAARTLLQSQGKEDLFVLRLGPGGEELWARGGGGPGTDAATGVTVDRRGVLLCGYFTDRIDLGGGPLRGAGELDALVARLSPTGEYIWSKSIGGSGSDAATAIAADASGLAVAGYIQGTLDSGGGPVTSAGGYDALLRRLAP